MFSLRFPSFSHDVRRRCRASCRRSKHSRPLRRRPATEASRAPPRELCVTPGAVSHQVKALEAELGLKLFNREHQRLLITEGGRAYLAVVRDAAAPASCSMSGQAFDFKNGAGEGNRTLVISSEGGTLLPRTATKA
jgi:Bacterial regulatory helix-turn-helix protein, lysR family